MTAFVKVSSLIVPRKSTDSQRQCLKYKFRSEAVLKSKVIPSMLKDELHGS